MKGAGGRLVRVHLASTAFAAGISAGVEGGGSREDSNLRPGDKGRFSPDVAARFATKTDRSGNCWIWRGGYRSGYGRFKVAGRYYGAHRVAWELTHGAIPAGIDICHRCDNPPCVRVRHLFSASHAANMADMARKGRQVRRRKLDDDTVATIRLRLARGVTGARLAREHGIARSTLHALRTGATWKHGSAA